MKIENENIFNKYEIEISNELMHSRISIVLYSYGLNEFYKSFKYLKGILIYLYEHKNVDIITREKAVEVMAKQYGTSTDTINNGMKKLFRALPADFFEPILRGRKKLTFNERFEYFANKVFVDIHFERVEKKRTY